MGETFIEAIQNNYGSTFGGSIQNQNCMYFVTNLLVINPGANNIGIEYKNSGSCFGATSYFIVAYALPGTPAGEFNWVIGLTSSGTLSLANPLWQATTLEYDGNTAYVWTLNGGISVTLNSFPSGTITQTVNAPAAGAQGPAKSAVMGEITVAGLKEGDS